MAPADLPRSAREAAEDGGLAVHELGSGLYGDGPPALADRMHPAADPGARFQHDHVETAELQLTRRGEPGNAGSDHDRVHDQRMPVDGREGNGISVIASVVLTF
jgi:hypothetical protein